MSAIDSKSRKEIELLISSLEMPKFRAAQIYEWIFSKYTTQFSEMLNLPQELRNKLSSEYSMSILELEDMQVSKQQNTIKWLNKLSDGVYIETVLMRQYYGNSLCVSTQAGCSMNCSFCASSLNGLQRNLTAGELFAQFRLAQKQLELDGEKLDNLVLMGTGEPLQNLREVSVFLQNIHDPKGSNFGYRRTTISTSGIVPGIYQLIEEGLPVNLAISLHAPNDELRDKIMPVNKSYPIHELLKAASDYAGKTGRRVTCEYLLIDQLNDTLQNAEELASLLKNKLISVNLIPYNPIKEKEYKRSTHDAIKKFMSILEKHQIPVSIRKEMGRDIDAACGQLRLKKI